MIILLLGTSVMKRTIPDAFRTLTGVELKGVGEFVKGIICTEYYRASRSCTKWLRMWYIGSPLHKTDICRFDTVTMAGSVRLHRVLPPDRRLYRVE
jgi:hypothetical protein